MSETRKWKNPLGPGVLYTRVQRVSTWLWTSISGNRAATGIRWPDTAGEERKHQIAGERVTRDQRTAYDRGIEILNKRVMLHQHPELALDEAAPAPQVPTLAAAIETFKGAMYAQLSPNIRTRYNIAFKRFLIADDQGDIPLTYDQIASRLVINNNRCELAPETKKKVLEKVRSFFGYCIEREWLTRNPIGAIGGVPPRPALDDDDIRVWEPEEVIDQVKQFKKMGMEINAIELRFTYRTGLREGEICRLKWSDISETAFRIEGKRSGRKGVDSTQRPFKERWFPLRDSDGNEWIPGLVEIITALRTYEGEFGEYVFPWRSVNDLTKEHRLCRRACKHDDGRKHLHYRKSAFAYWEDQLHLAPQVMTDLAGNSIDVWLRHYRKRRRKASQIAGQVRQRTSGADRALQSALPF